jgi:hypothetical protein
MAITGTRPFFYLQAGIEATPGTAVPATRIQPIVSGNWNETAERVFIEEERQSLIKNYRSVPTQQMVDFSGIEIAPTFEDLPWWLQFVAKGGVTGVVEDTAAYRYTFTPTTNANDLKTATFEWGDDTEDYEAEYCIATNMEITFSRNSPASMTMDWLGKQATTTTKTPALSQRVTEDLNGALAAVYIDADGGSFGSTAVTNVLEVTIGLPTMQSQFWALNGSLAPVDVYRSGPRSATVSMTMAFTSAAEYAAFKANFNDDAPRMVRVSVDGTQIPTTTTNKQAIFDLYTVWAEAPFGEQDGLRVVTFSGETKYDSSAGYDWTVDVVNGLVSLP